MFLTGVGGSQDAMKQIEEGGLYRATFLYNPNMAGTAVNMARLIGLGEGFFRARSPRSPASGDRSRCRRHERQRQPVRKVRVQLVVMGLAARWMPGASGGPRRRELWRRPELP
jgi:hypothetical protein